MMNINTIGVLLLFVAAVARTDAALPDPTRPADYSLTRLVIQDARKQKTEFNVNAIRISDIDRSAIINGRIVRVGDEINTATVKEINAAEVVLDYERKLVVIPLYSQDISKQFKSPEMKDR